MWALLLGAIVAGAVGCAGGAPPTTRAAADTAATTRPAVAAPREAREYLDLPYVRDGHERQVLDLHLPATPAGAAPAPLVVWVHGGGWDAGDKKNSPAKRLVERGYAVASINYRYSRHAIFPAQIHDVQSAVRYLRANAKQYDLDPDRFVAWGASAGGHLVALLGTAGDAAELEGDPGDHPGVSARVQAVIDWFGASELRKPQELPLNNNRIKLLGGRSEDKPELAALASPLAFVSAGDPPFLIMHGDKDKTVDLEHSVRLERALRDAGVEVTLVVIPGAGHGGDRFYEPQYIDTVDRFLDAHLRPAGDRR